MRKSIALISLISIIILLFSGCSTQKSAVENNEIFVMNTYVSQMVYGENRHKSIAKVNQLLRDTESMISLYKKESFIDQINQNAGESPVKVNDFTYDLVKDAYEYCKLSEGVFDITIAPLTKLWGITSQQPKVPKQEEIDVALSLIDYQKIEFDDANKTIYLSQKGMAIDLGGVAKGYICKAIQQEYEKLNISSALVSVGGNIFAYGLKPDGSKYTLGIRDPYGDEMELAGTLKTTNRVVATTGAYERYFEQDGMTYHHILDTKQGYPVQSDIASATVISKVGGLADFLSTTLFIVGTEYLEQYLNHEDFDVIIIDTNKNIYISDRIKNDFILTNDSYKLVKH